MRRILLSGLGIALGVFARPALAQQFPGRPASPNGPTAVAADPTNRVRLGRPMAVPDAQPVTPGVTPAGLFTRRDTPGNNSNVPSPMPGGYPAPGSGGAPPGSPQPMGSPPAVTESRDGAPRGVPSGGYYPVTSYPTTGYQDPGYPVPGYAAPGYAGPGVAIGSPMPVPESGAVMVPSVGPTEGMAYPGGVCPEDPLFCAPAPGMAAIHRIRSRPGDFWFGAEYLAWWTKSTSYPTLAGTGAPVVTVVDGNAQVTTPVPVLGGNLGADNLHSGARFSLGYWFDESRIRGVESRFLFLFENNASYTASSAQYPVLGRPFINANVPVGQLSDIIGFPGFSAGSITVETQSSLWGAEVNYRRNLLAGQCGFCGRLDALVGFRYLNFQEQLKITEVGVLTGAPEALSDRAPLASATDLFKAENNFYGGQVGLAGEIRRGRFFVDARATIAFGTVFQTTEIGGGQLQAFPNGAIAPAAGGLLALPGANSGTYTQSKFAVLPEVGFNVGYQFTPRLRAFIGYDILYLSSVVRPAGMIDTTVDASRVPNFLVNPPPVLPGTPRPLPRSNTTDFFAQGINFGMTWSW